MPTITYARETSTTGLGLSPLACYLGRWLARRGLSGSVEVALVDDARMRALHEQFLGDPAPTDVMAFDLSDGTAIDWQIVICVDVARAEARVRGIAPARELARYAIHGCLHNLGHDDHDPVGRRRMRAAERYHLTRLFTIR